MLPKRCVLKEMGGGVREKWAISEFRNGKSFWTCETPSRFGSKMLPFRKITALRCHLKFRSFGSMKCLRNGGGDAVYWGKVSKKKFLAHLQHIPERLCNSNVGI